MSPNDLLAAIPIGRLPPELLIEIFTHASQDPSHALVPVTLGNVCRYWRDIVYHSCHIWRHLYLADTRRPESSHAQAGLWLERCFPLPLSVHVHLEESADALLPLLSPILAHISLWERCCVTGKMHEEIKFPQVEGTQSRLVQLQVVVKGVSGMDTQQAQDADGGMTPTFRSYQPILPSPYHDVFMRVCVGVLPEPCAMSPLHITTLTVTEYSLEVSTDSARILGFLTCVPNLHTLNFYGWPHESTPGSEGAQLPVVSLSRLRTLLLRSTCAVRTLLSHLDAPVLTELYLEHTNVDFELLHDPYAHAAEDGDSDDEAHDFSQSPWSDHATGMGLRSLIHRSHPPLRVLEMDYADMRTKDFLWCFDRLEQLKEFRIVASDMSNSVIGFLAPYTPRRCRPRAHGDGEDGDGKAAQEPEEVELQRVRLPHLTSLELWHCQRLSGDAIVAALHKRVAFTDDIKRRKVNSVGETLADVAIVGCSDFFFHHALELEPVLGDRLRIQ